MFETIKRDLRCPACSTANAVTLERNKPAPAIACSGCGKSIVIDKTQFDAGLKRVDNAIADFKRRLRRR